MWTNTKIKEILIRLTLILVVVLMSLTSIKEQAFAQGPNGTVWLVRSIYTVESNQYRPDRALAGSRRMCQ